jgi:hypothetical protein
MADEFYRQVTDDHLARALAGDADAAQKAAQSVPVRPSKDGQGQNEDNKPPPVLPGFTSSYETGQYCLMGDTGFEPVTSRV